MLLVSQVLAVTHASIPRSKPHSSLPLLSSGEGVGLPSHLIPDLLSEAILAALVAAGQVGVPARFSGLRLQGVQGPGCRC